MRKVIFLLLIVTGLQAQVFKKDDLTNRNAVWYGRPVLFTFVDYQTSGKLTYSKAFMFSCTYNILKVAERSQLTDDKLREVWVSMAFDAVFYVSLNVIERYAWPKVKKWL